MKEIEFEYGITLEAAWNELQKQSEEAKEPCYGTFNGNLIYSTDTLDDVFVRIIGKTKAEFDAEQRRLYESRKRSEREFEKRLPCLTKYYIEKARGIIRQEKYEYWTLIVPIRLRDLYHGSELQSTLELCKIMKDNRLSFDARMMKARETFENQGHSGASGALVCKMLQEFCPLGDALANFIKGY